MAEEAIVFERELDARDRGATVNGCEGVVGILGTVNDLGVAGVSVC